MRTGYLATIQPGVGVHEVFVCLRQLFPMDMYFTINELNVIAADRGLCKPHVVFLNA